MAVPTGNYISDLDSTKPVGATEDANLVDDWLRYIQKCVKQSFPNVTGAVTATQTELNALAGSGVSATEMSYLNGVTSAIQTQLDAKAEASTDLTDTADLTYNADTDVSGNGWVDTDVSNNLSTKVPTEAAVKSYVDANAGLGVGQSWTDVTASRASGTTYTNNTGRAIQVKVIAGAIGTTNLQMYGYIDSVLNDHQLLNKGGLSLTVDMTISMIVPAGSTYKVDITSGGYASWLELS